MEKTRFDVLEKVVENLVEQKDKSFFDTLIVWDNNSQYPGTLELLKKHFPIVLQAQNNVGLWSGIHWMLHNYKNHIPRDLKYAYTIESDCLHYDLEQMPYCEQVLDDHKDIGSIRCQEFSISEKHLYDKNRQSKDSRRYAWVTQTNSVTGAPVTFTKIDGYNDRMYKSNFLAQIPNLNRIRPMRDILDELEKKGPFCEQDFRARYHDLYPDLCVLDGGMWESKLGAFYESTITASFSPVDAVKKAGYRTTRQATMDPLESFSVELIKG
jgi:hypothetical protein